MHRKLSLAVAAALAAAAAAAGVTAATGHGAPSTGTPPASRPTTAGPGPHAVPAGVPRWVPPKTITARTAAIP